MKTIGLIGGMSWESTQVYYRLINQFTAGRLGGLHSAKLWLHSVDFFEIEELQKRGEWAAAGEALTAAAQGLERAGADFIVLCTNTMHIVAPQIQRECSIPLLHIADATAGRIRRRGIDTVGLLGTRFTMEKDFYAGRLRERHGLDVLVPEQSARDEIHRIIYEELCLGRIEQSSRERFEHIMGELNDQGAQGIIFGCTEISLLVGEAQARVPVFDTTLIHAQAAVEYALDGE